MSHNENKLFLLKKLEIIFENCFSCSLKNNWDTVTYDHKDIIYNPEVRRSRL